MGFPGGSMVKNLPANAGDIRDAGSIPGLGRSPGGGNGYPLQYSCLEKPILERSIELNAKDPAPHYRLARVYYRLGRKEEAAQQRRLHEKLSEEQENARGGRGMAVERPRSPGLGPEK